MVFFVRGSFNPLPGLICLVLGLLYRLLKSAAVSEHPRKPPLPSFRFSGLKETDFRPVRIVRTKIRGVSFDNADGTSRQRVIRTCCHAGDALLLLRDRGNPADPNAVAVVRICRGHDGKATFREQLGYLSKELAGDLSLFFSDAPLGFAEILDISGGVTGCDGGSVGVNIRAEIYAPEDDVAGGAGSGPSIDGNQLSVLGPGLDTTVESWDSPPNTARP